MVLLMRGGQGSLAAPVKTTNGVAERSATGDAVRTDVDDSGKPSSSQWSNAHSLWASSQDRASRLRWSKPKLAGVCCACALERACVHVPAH
jgi:hypothetical protein